MRDQLLNTECNVAEFDWKFNRTICHSYVQFGICLCSRRCHPTVMIAMCKELEESV